jgi:hypothetical protein
MISVSASLDFPLGRQSHLHSTSLLVANRSQEKCLDTAKPDQVDESAHIGFPPPTCHGHLPCCYQHPSLLAHITFAPIENYLLVNQILELIFFRNSTLIRKVIFKNWRKVRMEQSGIGHSF